MTRILLLGYALPRHAPEVRKEAYNYRTWQLGSALAGGDHVVRLAAVDLLRPPMEAARTRVLDDSMDAWIVDHRRRGWRREFQTLCEEFRPEGVVATGQLLCLVACGLRTKAPLWFDLYGDPVFEWQAAMATEGSPRGLRSVIGFQKTVLQRGDVFSTVSTPQTEAFRGKLGLVGRLNHLTNGYEFVYTIPPGFPTEVEHTAEAPILRGPHVPADAFVVLWVGGYNAWSDPVTLFAGIEAAMAQESRIHFVSIGGPVVSDSPYRRFQDLVATSRHQGRYHLIGWRKQRAEVLKAYQEADVGISVDLPIYETHFGSRTRLLEMLRYDLPVVTSEGCELAEMLRAQGAALTFPTQDANALAGLLVKAARDPELLQSLAARGRALVHTLGFQIATSPLLAWTREPRPAPDRSWRLRWTITNALRWWWRAARWQLTGRL